LDKDELDDSVDDMASTCSHLRLFFDKDGRLHLEATIHQVYGISRSLFLND
jgi:hypothetical protein